MAKKGIKKELSFTEAFKAALEKSLKGYLADNYFMDDLVSDVISSSEVQKAFKRAVQPKILAALTDANTVSKIVAKRIAAGL